MGIKVAIVGWVWAFFVIWKDTPLPILSFFAFFSGTTTSE
jgi:hypothetical protein